MRIAQSQVSKLQRRPIVQMSGFEYSWHWNLFISYLCLFKYHLKMNNWIEFPKIFRAISKSFQKQKIIFYFDIINELNCLKLNFNDCKYDLKSWDNFQSLMELFLTPQNMKFQPQYLFIFYNFQNQIKIFYVIFFDK